MVSLLFLLRMSMPVDLMNEISVPLCFIYPAMLHYKAVAKTRTQKLCDILLGVFGMGAMVFTTAQTIKVRSASFSPSCYPDPANSLWLHPKLRRNQLQARAELLLNAHHFHTARNKSISLTSHIYTCFTQ